jgi:uncharacterized protein with von Willebrand factor type A (vWA) domain
MATQEQIDSFHQFATEQIQNGGREKSVDELYDQWRLENLSSEELDENVAAIQGAIDDMKNGDRGRDVMKSLLKSEASTSFRHLNEIPHPDASAGTRRLCQCRCVPL